MGATTLSARSLRLPSRQLRAAPDERLVAALRRGDEAAFEAIYDRHHGALLGFCRHMLGSHEEAEDALQHVFVSAHRHLFAGRATVNLKPWLYTIARNRCLSMLRARRATLALDDVDEPRGAGLAVADEVELGEDLNALLGDIARLPVDQRAALVLAELGDLSQQEIAAILDVRSDKVKALIFQAREALAGWRQARGASCSEIREQLATLNGSTLRRAPIRRHVTVCANCAAFETEVKRQRAALALVLPVVPSATLKHSVLTATLSGGHGVAAGGATAATAAASGASASGLTVKALAVAALAVCGGGGAVTMHELEQPQPVQRAAAATTARTPAAAAAPASSVRASPRGIPVAAQPRSATPAPTHRRDERPGSQGTPPRVEHGRGPHSRGTRSAPGRQRAPGSAQGRERAQGRHGQSRVAKPLPAAKTHLGPTSPRRPVAAARPMPERAAVPPVTARGKTAPPVSAPGTPAAASDPGGGATNLHRRSESKGA
jgi:RNA polymerase sigma factor (sigma-70 family)